MELVRIMFHWIKADPKSNDWYPYKKKGYGYRDSEMHEDT